MDFAYWFFVFLTGFLAQYCISIQDFFLGLFLYGAAGAGAFCLIIRNQISGIDQPEGNTPQHPFEETGFGSYTSNSSIRFDSQWLFLILAIASWISCITFIWKGTKLHLPDYMGWGLYAWIGFIFIAITSLYKIWLPFIRRFAWREWLPLGYLLLFSILAGIFHLSSIPATVHGDEGMVGLHARRILEGQISSFFTLSWYEIPQFFFFIPACTMKIFGDSLFGLRMSAVLIGTASLIPFYLLVKDWWGKKAAVFGGILLITNHWFLFLSHSGVNYVQNCFFAITLLCLWHFANRNRSIGLCILAGITMGFGLISYQANHLLPVLWIASQLWIWLLRQIGWKWALPSIIVPLIIAIALIAPWYTIQIAKNDNAVNNAMFTNRAGGVFILSEANRHHLNFSYQTKGDFSKALRIQFERAYLSPIYYPDTSMQYSGTKPFLDPVLSVFFMLALIIGSIYFFDARWSVPIFWILAILTAGGALTVDAPFYPRLAGLTALFFVLIAAFFSSVLRSMNRNNFLAYAVYGFFGICAVFSAGYNLHYFFSTYANQVSSQNAHYAQTQLAYFVKEKPRDNFFYVFSGVHMMFNSGTVSFLAKGYNGKDLDTIPETWMNPPFWIVIDGTRETILYKLREKFPAAKEAKALSPQGFVLFYSLLIE